MKLVYPAYAKGVALMLIDWCRSTVAGEMATRAITDGPNAQVSLW